ncbi:MAG: TIGR03620 family F420-dependent LLM class oxidoreductase [Mycobacteriales bacterium]
MTLFGRPVGIWTGALEALPPPALCEQVAALDEQGWASLWYGEAYGREAFTNAAMVLGASERLKVGTGIANIYGRDAVAMKSAALTVAAQFPGRFVCGMGVSHQPLVERMRGHKYTGPVSTMRAYLDAMDQAPYLAVAPAEPPPFVLAALGPRMLELARDRTAGAHPYLTTPEHTAQAKQILGPDKELVVEMAAVLSDDPDVWKARAHWHLEIYTGLPNYVNNWKRLGFGDDDAVRGGSDRLKEALVARGETAIRAKVDEHLEAGATQVVVQVLGEGPGDVPADDWRRLAPALTS